MWAYREMAVDLMVIHRSCSSFRVSVKRASPALAAEMMPARWTRESVKVDFPWSTSWTISGYDVKQKHQQLTMGNHRHIPDVCRLVHESTDLQAGQHSDGTFHDSCVLKKSLPLPP